MSIFTINRGSYSRGKEVAERLAVALGYDCVSRDILLDASEEFNIPEIKLVRALHDPVSVFDRFQHGRERYISYLHSALLQKAKNDNLVYHGLAGQFFLRNIPHVLKVRIIADMNIRVQEEMRRENIPEETARYILQKDDDERREWGLQVYGMDTWDSRLYDIVLCIGKLTVDDAVKILADLVRNPEFQTTPESQLLIQDQALSARVVANLAASHPRTQVAARSGVVFITAMDQARDSRAQAKVSEIALAVEGVREVVFDIAPPESQVGHVNPFHNL
jgi:cytidylate kinase